MNFNIYHANMPVKSWDVALGLFLWTLRGSTLGGELAGMSGMNNLSANSLEMAL